MGFFRIHDCELVEAVEENDDNEEEQFRQCLIQMGAPVGGGDVTVGTDYLPFERDEPTTKDANNNDNNNKDPAWLELKSMFPDLDESQLIEALRINQWETALAADFLLRLEQKAQQQLN